MKQRFPGFHLKQQPDGTLYFDGYLEPIPNVVYHVVVVYPRNYPFSPPTLWMVQPYPERGCPHLYMDGSLCIYKRNHAWNTERGTAASVIPLAAVWVLLYAIWQSTGEVVLMKELVLSRNCWSEIVNDCRRHPGTETGGILVGQRIGDVFIAPFTVLAGDHARREVAEFAPDETYQQVLLDYLFGRFEVNFLGDWHRHPGAFDRPSLHDLLTARQMLSNPAWALSSACFPIVTIQKGEVCLRAYAMSRETLELRK